MIYKSENAPKESEKVCYILTKIDFSSTVFYTFFMNYLCL